MKQQIHPLVAIACLVVITAGMKAAASILNPVLLAMLLAVSIMPLIMWQTKKGVPNGVAIVLTIVIVILAGSGLTVVLGLSVARLAQKLPTYESQVTDLLKGFLDFLSAKGIDISNLRELEAFSPANLVKYAIRFLSGTISAFGNAVVVLFLVVFLLIEFTVLRAKHEKGLLPAASWIVKFGTLGDELRKYVSITALTGLYTATANVILLVILGVDFPIMWGFLSFLFNFIPSIGFFISLIPPVLLGLLESGAGTAIIVIIGFFLINAFVENVVKPRLMGKELDVSILLIFVSLVFWSWVLGAIGAIMAVPLTITLKKIWEVTREPQASSAAPSNQEIK
ncbi:MAG: AI-2E family transporter [Nitrospirota bacterium]